MPISRFAAAPLLLVAAAAPAKEGTDYFAVVNGSRYRVTVKGDEVRVNKKAALVKYSIAERDAQRQAVHVATGCNIVDELPNGAKLRGKLECPAGLSPNQQRQAPK